MTEKPSINPPGIRWYTDRAMEHALGILDSCDDESFWGDDYDPNDVDWEMRAKAKEFIMNRIRKHGVK